MTEQKQRDLKSLMGGLNKEDLKSVLIEGAKQLPDEDKGAVADEIRSGMGQPSDPTRDRLWIIVIAGFAVVLIGSFITLAIAVFQTQDTTRVNLVKPELVLSMFTSAVGFLAGLFVPSPIANKQK